jgi:Bacterial SH3 domain
MFKNMIKGLIALLLFVGLTSLQVEPSFAQAATTGNKATPVTFASGSRSSTFKGSVVRGDRRTYTLAGTLAGKKGQAIALSITSPENNAVFDVVDPSGKAIKAAAASWVGPLLADGNYKVLVGGTRGNASYALTVAQIDPDYQTEVKTNTICSFINANGVNLRQDPSVNASIITQFNTGDGVRALSRSGDWVKVVARVSGQSPEIYSPLEGYVSNKYINGCSEDQFDRWRK